MGGEKEREGQGRVNGERQCTEEGQLQTHYRILLLSLLVKQIFPQKQSALATCPAQVECDVNGRVTTDDHLPDQ